KKKYPSSKLTLLFFNYGQKSVKQERFCAKNCANNLKMKFIEISLSELTKISTSFINKDEKAIHGKSLHQTTKEQTQWYVPFRNTIFLSYAFAYAESLAFKDKKKDFFIVVGFKCEGKEPYPDTTVDYVRAMNSLAKTAAPSLGIKVYAPLIMKDKEDIILLGKKLGVDFEKTWSCYVGEKKHCGACLACRLRRAGFYWAGTTDPTSYCI
ncbi:MAG: 7-cyano-7-deazaguanine synthase, partial [Nanoarchaeota archaeon]